MLLSTLPDQQQVLIMASHRADDHLDLRSLRVAWSDVVDHHNMLEQIHQEPKVSRDARKVELHNVAKALSCRRLRWRRLLRGRCLTHRLSRRPASRPSASS